METISFPGEVTTTLPALRAMTVSKALALPGAERTGLMFGDSQSPKGGIDVELVESKIARLTLQLLGANAGWRSVIALLEAPNGKLWWDADTGVSSNSINVALRLDTPEAKDWKLELNQYGFYDEDGMKYISSFTASRAVGRPLTDVGWAVGFDETGAFQSARGSLKDAGVEAAAKRFGIEPGTFDQKTETPEWMPAGISQVVLTPKSADWGGFVVTLTIEKDQVVGFTVAKPVEEGD